MLAFLLRDISTSFRDYLTDFCTIMSVIIAG